MMRVCHLDTCPVGIATQNPELRERFTRQARVRRELLRVHRRGGARAPGRARVPHARRGHRPRRGARHPPRPIDHWKASGLDLSPILHVPERPFGDDLHCTSTQDHGLERALDQQLISAARDGASTRATPVKLEFPIRNVNRTVGTMLGHEVTKRHGGAGPARRHDRHHLHRFGRPELRRVRAEGHHAAAARRRQRLRRARACPAAGSSCARRRRSMPTSCAEDNIIAGNVAALRRHRRRGVLPRPGRRAVLRPQLRRHRGGRGRRRPRLRVHDRRPGRRARPDRPELRRRHVGRHRLRLRPRADASPPV